MYCIFSLILAKFKMDPITRNVETSFIMVGVRGRPPTSVAVNFSAAASVKTFSEKDIFELALTVNYYADSAAEESQSKKREIPIF